MSRYRRRSIGLNNHEMYEDQFLARRVHYIKHYTTPVLKHADADDMAGIDEISHAWSLGDKFYKLAHEHYGSSQYWWVIAWWNQRPLETSFIPGDVVEIPEPLNKVLEYYNL